MPATEDVATSAASTGFVTVASGCRIRYARRGAWDAASGGAAAGPVVALLHGSDGFLHDFDAVLEAWPGDGSRIPVVAFDRPGHGLSDAPPNGGALPVQIALLRDALQQLCDGADGGAPRPVLLVGHSWGAAFALAWAIAHPNEVAGLVLLSPWVAPGVDPPSILLRTARRIGPRAARFLLVNTPLKRWLLRWHLRQAWSPDLVPRAYEQAAEREWQQTTTQVAVFLHENTDVWARLPAIAAGCAEITAPVVVVTGARDKALHADRHAAHLARVLPHAVCRIAPDTGHELPHLRPDLVWEAARDTAATGRAHAATRPGENARSAASETSPREQARLLALRWGWNVTAYQILNSEMSLWFSDDRETVVGYVERFRLRIAAGAPVGDPERVAAVAQAFERDARAHGLGVCWFAVTPRLQNLFARADPARVRAAFTVGAQPAWDPRNWEKRATSNRTLRAQLNRARNKGVVVSEWPVARAQTDPDLRRCRDEWLAYHPLPSLRFLTEPVALGSLGDRRIFVAETEGGAVIGFLLAAPVPTRRGWLIEQITRGADAPNGTAERLVDFAFHVFGAENFEYVTLGLVPLSRRAVTDIPAASAAPTPPRPWLRAALAYVRLHGRRFYNFEGLDAFKAKFKPETWEPILAVFDTPRVPPHALLAIAAAFTDGPLPLTLARAALSAAREEARRLRHRLASKP